MYYSDDNFAQLNMWNRMETWLNKSTTILFSLTCRSCLLCRLQGVSMFEICSTHVTRCILRYSQYLRASSGRKHDTI